MYLSVGEGTVSNPKTASLTILILSGSIILLVFGFLTAFIPRLAYVKVVSYVDLSLRPVPYVEYFSTAFSVYTRTLGLLLAGVGGLFCLFSAVLNWSKSKYVFAAGVSLSSISLLFSAFPNTSSWPYSSTCLFTNYIQLPWVGTILAFTGLAMVFAGFVLKSRLSHKLLFSLLLLFLVYLAYPIMIALGHPPLLQGSSDNLVAIIIGTSLITGNLLMVWSVLKELYLACNGSKHIFPLKTG